MDIQRQAFEVYLLSEGVDLKYLPCIYFNGTSYDQQDGDDDYQEALGEINLGWNAWQAAKAQANKQFEGFIDQAIEDSACADERRSLQCLLDEFRELSMIEAQEKNQ